MAAQVREKLKTKSASSWFGSDGEVAERSGLFATKKRKNMSTDSTTADNTTGQTKPVVLLPPVPWEASEQRGKPGHCFLAQVVDADGKSFAVIESTDDERVASKVAQVMAASFDLLAACKALLHELPRNSGGIQARRIGQAKKAIWKAGENPYC